MMIHYYLAWDLMEANEATLILPLKLIPPDSGKFDIYTLIVSVFLLKIRHENI